MPGPQTYLKNRESKVRRKGQLLSRTRVCLRFSPNEKGGCEERLKMQFCAQVKNPAAEPDCLGLNLGSSIYQVREPWSKYLTSLVFSDFSAVKQGDDNSFPHPLLGRLNVPKYLGKCQINDKCYVSVDCEYYYKNGEQDATLGFV